MSDRTFVDRPTERKYSAVGVPSIQARHDLATVQQGRASGKGKLTLGPSSGLESVKVIPGVVVLTKKPMSGRVNPNGPLIESGHTGQTYNPGDTRYSLKEESIFLGIPATGTYDKEKKESITIYTGAGMATMFVTDAFNFGDSLTFLPPDVNKGDYSQKSIADARALMQQHAQNYIPTHMVPVTKELLVDSLMPMIDLFVAELKAGGGNAATVSGVVQNWANDRDPYKRAVFNSIYYPALIQSRLFGQGGSQIEFAVAYWYGKLSERMSEQLLRSYLPAAARAGVTPEMIRDSKSAFTRVHASISEMKEAVAPVVVAVDSGEPGSKARVILTK